MHKVKGKGNLIKDPNSGCIINSDTTAFKGAKAAKNRILKEQKEKEEIQSRLDRLEATLDEFLNRDNSTITSGRDDHRL